MWVSTRSSVPEAQKRISGNPILRRYRDGSVLMSPTRRLLVLRFAAWLCVALIAYLSLIPRSMEVRTSLLPGLEHVLAYGGTAGFMVLAYPGRPTWLIIGALCAYSGLMEGRHPGLDGALWSSAGAIMGGLSIAPYRRRPDPSPNEQNRDDGDGHQDRHGDEHAGT